MSIPDVTKGESTEMFNNETQVKVEKKMWSVKEDIVLMKSWCLASEDKKCGRNKRRVSLWKKVHNLYHEARKENPNELSERNADSMKGRWKRLDENGIKWIAVYKEAHDRIASGMSQKDVEKEAHAIYEAKGKKFQDWLVFNEVMSKHPRWDIKLDHDSTRPDAENEANEEGMSKHPKRDIKLHHDSTHCLAQNEENEKGMSKHPKWDIQLDHDSTRSLAENEENEKGISEHPKWDIQLDHDSTRSHAENEENEKGMSKHPKCDIKLHHDSTHSRAENEENEKGISEHPKWDIQLDHDSTRSHVENEENEKGMNKHPKWDIKLHHDSTRSRAENEENEKGDEESGGSSKRSRINEDGECSISFKPEIPSSRCSTIPRPEDGDKVKNKENVKTSQPSSTNEVATEIRALRLTRDNEVELMMKLESARIELEREKEKRKILKMNQVMLNTLLAKDHLSPEDEEMKRHLMAIVLRQ